jgi:hypothetical protein
MQIINVYGEEVDVTHTPEKTPDCEVCNIHQRGSTERPTGTRKTKIITSVEAAPIKELKGQDGHWAKISVDNQLMKLILDQGPRSKEALKLKPTNDPFRPHRAFACEVCYEVWRSEQRSLKAQLRALQEQGKILGQ